jgi:hypothetical protein
VSSTEGINRFLGRGWCFPPAFDLKSKNIKMVSGEEDIKESLWILLATTPGERVMEPDYGCGINAMMFESIDLSSKTRIKSLVEKAILFYEPRVDLQEVNVLTDDYLQGLLKIELTYTIIATNTRGNMVYPFYLQEATHVEI